MTLYRVCSVLVEGNSILSKNWADDFFSVRPTDWRFDCVKMQSFSPVESLSHARKVTFILPRFLGPNMYLPDRMLLKIEVALSLEGADRIPNAKKVAPINDSFHAIFKTCRIWLGETAITKNGENYPYKSYMIDFLSMDANAKFSWMRGQMWHQDTFGHTLENQTDLNINAGFKSRMHRFKNEDQTNYVTHSIPLMGRLHSDLGSTNSALCPGLGMKVELVFSSNEFVIQVPESDSGKYKLTITDANLFCPVAQVSADMFRKIEKNLEEKNMRMYLRRTEVTNKNIPANTELFVSQLFPGAPLPSKMVLGIVPTASFVGTYHTNPFFFPRNFSFSESVPGPSGNVTVTHRTFIERVAVTLNGESLDGLDSGITNSSEDMVNFIRLHYYMGFMQSRTGNAVTYEEFCNGFYFLYYDLSTGGQAINAFVIPAVRQGNLQIQINFAKAYPKELTLVIFAEYPTLVEVNKYRQIIMSY